VAFEKSKKKRGDSGNKETIRRRTHSKFALRRGRAEVVDFLSHANVAGGTEVGWGHLDGDPTPMKYERSGRNGRNTRKKEKKGKA